MLFGTDGIRGEVVDSPKKDRDTITRLLERREISPRLMRLVGEALARFVGLGSKVIIGWDNRPRNYELVSSLTVGLHLGGSRVIHAGICATPGLHNSIFETNSAMGCMITASHNPVYDSGIKIFDANGFKTGPEIEKDISELIVQLASEEREVDSNEIAELEKPDVTFEADLSHQKLIKKRFDELCKVFAEPKLKRLSLDSSKGIASEWLSDFLCSQGIKCNEISLNATALNRNCGAGELSPTDSWTWDEAAKDEHLLIRSLEKTSPGQIVAAALDGDGDRCLLIESTKHGFRVVDGDEMADHILRSAKGNWHLAASIESDLALGSSLERLKAKVKFSQTAVGDRWLSQALRKSGQNVLGVEDSGHLVLSAPNPNGGRCLVGDGIASMFAVLCSMGCDSRQEKFQRGYKNRVSISPSNRNLWDGGNHLADKVESIAEKYLGEMNRSGLVGENNLMLLENGKTSIGVRNSGTQAKTNISLRVAPGVENSLAIKALEDIRDYLTRELQANF